MTETQSDETECPKEPPLSPEDFRLWRKYEEIAMHFNDLIMRWRLQAIGGLVTLVMFAGTVVNGLEDRELRYWGMLLLSGTLICAWVGITIIDLSYYRRLLSGAVEELLKLEARLPLKFSTTIERAKCGGQWGPYLFYLSGALPLVAIAGYAIWRLEFAQ